MTTPVYLYLHPFEIKFKTNDMQLVGYQRCVQSWLTQWTVANNYSPIVCADYRDAVKAAEEVWMAQLVRDVRMHFGRYLPKDNTDLQIRRDFEFLYWQATVVLGKPFDYQLGNIKTIKE